VSRGRPAAGQRSGGAHRDPSPSKLVIMDSVISIREGSGKGSGKGGRAGQAFK